jgi:hypothetical protein
MEFRRNAQRHERRRRVLIEEARSEERSGSSDSSGRRGAANRSGEEPAHGYSAGALRANQPHLTDLLPVRPFVLSMLLLGGLCGLVGLQAIYGQLYVMHPLRLNAAERAGFDLARGDSLAGGFAALLLAAASLVGGQIYALRKHRVDDYRGRYRAWLWISPLLLCAALNSIAGLHRALGATLARLAGWNTPHQMTLAWLSVCCGLGLLVVVRLALEMRPQRLPMLALALATGHYAAVAILTGWQLIAASPCRVMLVSWLWLSGHLALLAALVLYARNVYLQAQGRLPRKRPEAAAEKAATIPLASAALDPDEAAATDHEPAQAAKPEQTPVGPPSAPSQRKKKKLRRAAA